MRVKVRNYEAEDYKQANIPITYSLVLEHGGMLHEN